MSCPASGYHDPECRGCPVCSIAEKEESDRLHRENDPHYLTDDELFGDEGDEYESYPPAPCVGCGEMVYDGNELCPDCELAG